MGFSNPIRLHVPAKRLPWHATSLVSMFLTAGMPNQWLHTQHSPQPHLEASLTQTRTALAIAATSRGGEGGQSCSTAFVSLIESHPAISASHLFAAAGVHTGGRLGGQTPVGGRESTAGLQGGPRLPAV